MNDNRHVTIISFTQAGSQLNDSLNQRLSVQGYTCESFTVPKYALRFSISGIPRDREAWIGERWGKTAFVFIGAAGIAIRYTVPWIKDKYTDSAVLCLDEKGAFAIPLIAGHMGGGVALAKIIAKATNGTPVITTATDVRGKFAVDVFANKHNLEIGNLDIGNRHLVKEISSAVLNGDTIGMYSEIELSEPLPKEVAVVDSPEDLGQYPYGVFITRVPAPQLEPTPQLPLKPQTSDLIEDDIKADWQGRENILYLSPRLLQSENGKRPKSIIVGIGCRKGVSRQHISGQLAALLKEHGLTMAQVKLIASIDLKKSETGIVELAKEYGIPYITYSVEELEQITEVSSQSLFVRQTVGVDNVCERAAKLAAGKGILVQPKICMDDVTFSLVRERKAMPRILVFAGTTEGRNILAYLQGCQVAVIACVATEYGKTSLADGGISSAFNIEVRKGRLTESEMSQMLKSEDIELVIDATHPFARVVTKNIQSACKTTETEYIRLLRLDNADCQGGEHAQGKEIVFKDGIKAVVDYLMNTKGNILISTGSKELKEYLRIPGYKERCYARVLSTKQSVDDSTALGFEGAHLIAMQGPFSKSMNVATLEQTKAAYFVTKESGVSGGFDEKLAAARERGVQLVVIGRPEEEGMTMEETCRLLKGRYTC